jgi:hypothetical protein
LFNYASKGLNVMPNTVIASEEIKELRLAAKRYETARKMNPTEWKELWEMNVRTGIPFDELIDNRSNMLMGT